MTETTWRPSTLSARFLAKVRVEERSGCWIWTGYRTPLGYGKFRVGGRTGEALLAHRVSYETTVGPIPEGLDLDHLCNHRACVRPDHLRPATHFANVRRAWGGNADATRCVRGHSLEDPGNVYVRPHDLARICRTCQRAAQRRFRATRAA